MFVSCQSCLKSLLSNTAHTHSHTHTHTKRPSRTRTSTELHHRETSRARQKQHRRPLHTAAARLLQRRSGASEHGSVAGTTAADKELLEPSPTPAHYHPPHSRHTYPIIPLVCCSVRSSQIREKSPHRAGCPQPLRSMDPRHQSV